MKKFISYIYPPIRQDIRWHRIMKVIGWVISVCSIVYFPLVFILYFTVIQRAILYIVYGKNKGKWLIDSDSENKK